MEYRRAAEAAISGTNRMGEVDATYADLTLAFGRPYVVPEDGGDGKTRRQWVLRFDDGVIATVYDYKTCDDRFDDVNGTYTWHIGGRGAGVQTGAAAGRYVADALRVVREHRDVIASVRNIHLSL